MNIVLPHRIHLPALKQRINLAAGLKTGGFFFVRSSDTCIIMNKQKTPR
jgi:hypothetical protein